ncbi:hypothetical protein BH11BAC6_BH11BAC6_06340 [soil metagenome]
MKKIVVSLLICVGVSLVSCIDTEEKITLHADKSGTYELSIDLSSMMEQLKAIKPDEAKAFGQDKDTIINFSSFTDTSTTLTAEEKELLKKGSMHIVMGGEKDQMKMAFKVPFKDVQQLMYLKQHMYEMIDKLKAEKNIFGDDDAAANDDAADNADRGGMGKDPGNLLNPAQQAFTFNIQNNTISNKLTDKNVVSNWLATDSSMQMIMPMLSMLGDFNYTTTFILPSPVKQYSGGSESKLSDDKKTITFINTLSGMVDKPESFEYNIEY